MLDQDGSGPNLTSPGHLIFFLPGLGGMRARTRNAHPWPSRWLSVSCCCPLRFPNASCQSRLSAACCCLLLSAAVRHSKTLSVCLSSRPIVTSKPHTSQSINPSRPPSAHPPIAGIRRQTSHAPNCAPAADLLLFGKSTCRCLLWCAVFRGEVVLLVAVLAVAITIAVAVVAPSLRLSCVFIALRGRVSPLCVPTPTAIHHHADPIGHHPQRREQREERDGRHGLDTSCDRRIPLGGVATID